MSWLKWIDLLRKLTVQVVKELTFRVILHPVTEKNTWKAAGLDPCWSKTVFNFVL